MASASRDGSSGSAPSAEQPTDGTPQLGLAPTPLTRVRRRGRNDPRDFRPQEHRPELLRRQEVRHAPDRADPADARARGGTSPALRETLAVNERRETARAGPVRRVDRSGANVDSRPGGSPGFRLKGRPVSPNRPSATTSRSLRCHDLAVSVIGQPDRRKEQWRPKGPYETRRSDPVADALSVTHRS